MESKEQMKTYTKSDFHNPEQLTRQQVGAQYRLLLNGEIRGRRIHRDGIELIVAGGAWRDAHGDSKQITYRVPLATPLPDGTVLSSNECCFSDAPAKPRIYCAGGMTGYVDYNFPAFFKAAAELEQQGYEVLNPAQMDLDCGYTLEKLKQLSPAEFQEFLKGAVKRDLDAIQTCQAIAMLPGWESSKGAKAELALAQWLGLEVIYLNGDTPTEPPQPHDSDKRFFFRDGKWVSGHVVIPSSQINPEYIDAPYDVTEYKLESKQPYNSDERAEWSNDCGKIDMGDYSSTATAQYAPDDPKGAAGAKKAPMDLLPPDALLETARAMGHGAEKYGRWNFIEAKVCAHTYVAAIGRHWASYAKGQDDDAESGLKHLAHIAANCFILMAAAQQGTLNDDRPRLK